jgi:hypothetical protein
MSPMPLFSPLSQKGATDLILSPAPLHGYNAAQEAVWNDAIKQQLRTPDDGAPISVFDWLDLNALARHAFLSPKQEERL